MEEGAVTLVRANGAIRYPARVTLIAAMNPCPCGYAGDPAKACTCPPGAVNRYVGRIGGPLYDRMDISVRIDRVDPALLIDGSAGQPGTAEARLRVSEAIAFGASRPARGLRSALLPAARMMLEDSARQLHLSGRAVTRMLRVARTIADMARSMVITEDHIAEALGYRAWEPL
jgi:magnesium chelatase family protein